MSDTSKKDVDTEPKNTASDISAMALRSAVGWIPFAGPILSEVITQLIPNQRQDRMADYLRRLNEKLEHLTDEIMKKNSSTIDGIDLFEEGAFQSSRATSDERREYIANLVAYGLSWDQKERAEAKRLLTLLNQLDDQQIIILASKSDRYLFDEDYHELHDHVLTPPITHFNSSKDEIADKAVYDLAVDQLFNLGLLRKQFKKPPSKGNYEFDLQTGMVKSTGKSITSLGRLVLRRIGIAIEDNEDDE